MVTGRDYCLVLFSFALAPLALLTTSAGAQDLGLSPTRPTVANSGTIQDAGVLQVELGYDEYPQRDPGNQQSTDVLFTYAAFPRLRLDLDIPYYNYQQASPHGAQGFGTVQLGGKTPIFRERYHHAAPGIGIQYEVQLPTGTSPLLSGYGQQAILLLNHHYGKNGDLDVIANGSVVQANCNTPTRCSYGGQQSFALSYHLQKTTRLYAEAFSQNVSQSNTPPGTYVFGGFYHQFSDAFGLDGGLRFGVTDRSASIGTTIGIVYGKRVVGKGGR